MSFIVIVSDIKNNIYPDILTKKDEVEAKMVEFQSDIDESVENASSFIIGKKDEVIQEVNAFNSSKDDVLSEIETVTLEMESVAQTQQELITKSESLTHYETLQEYITEINTKLTDGSLDLVALENILTFINQYNGLLDGAIISNIEKTGETLTISMSNNTSYDFTILDGNDGADGADGADGETFYTWIKYADDGSGNGLSDNPSSKPYIGIAYNKQNPVESTNPNDYSWSLIKGYDGIDGINGTNGQDGSDGADGITYYTWIKYADDIAGNGMSDDPTGKEYIGLSYNKTTSTESTNKADYTWSLFKGSDGVAGADGQDGADGVNGADGANGERGAGFYRIGIAGGVWNDTTANSALPNNTPVQDDIVTIYDSNLTTVSTTKKYDGSSWVVSDFTIDGDMIVTGTLDASKITTGKLKNLANTTEIDLDAGTMRLGDSSEPRLEFDGKGLYVSGMSVQAKAIKNGSLGAISVIEDRVLDTVTISPFKAYIEDKMYDIEGAVLTGDQFQVIGGDSTVSGYSNVYVDKDSNYIIEHTGTDRAIPTYYNDKLFIFAQRTYKENSSGLYGNYDDCPKVSSINDIYEDNMSHDLDASNSVNGMNGFSLGLGNSVDGGGGLAIGSGNTVTGRSGIAIGENNTVNDIDGFALGRSSTAGYRGYTFGHGCLADGWYGLSTGYETIADFSAFATNYKTKATASYSSAFGYYTSTGIFGLSLSDRADCSAIFGKNGNIGGTSSNAIATLALAYGVSEDYDTGSSATGLVWKATKEGDTFQDGTVNTTGADYAEYFETADGNTIEAGYFVSFANGSNKIEIGNSDIVGIVSTDSALIGDSVENSWNNKYLMDEFNRYIFEDVEQEDGSIINQRKLNPEWDASVEYIPRSKRDEWVAVGLLGKLFVYYEDGEVLNVGDYVTSNADGKAIKCDKLTPNSYRVLEIKAEHNLCRVFFR